MPDLEATAAALLALAHGDRVVVDAALPSIAVSERYAGHPEHGRTSPASVFTVIADLDPATGEYRLRYQKQERVSGWWDGGYRWSWSSTASNQRLMEMTTSKFVALDGVVIKERFDSSVLEGRVIAVVEAQGWARPRRTGFWARLFGGG